MKVLQYHILFQILILENHLLNPKLLEPFVPFSKDSDGGINSLFYCGTNCGEGDIVILWIY